MRVASVGVLLRGEPGAGKSSLALGLLDRGHQLVADDAPLLRREGDSVVGECPAQLRGLLHVRGMPGFGLLDIVQLFGADAWVPRSAVALLCDLGEEQPPCLVGATLPRVCLPTDLLIDAALWVETAARAILASHQAGWVDPLNVLNDRHLEATACN